jgi:hypothetical protein
MSRVIEPHGLSLAQYNVLRILRGAGDEGLATLAIRNRMIEEGLHGHAPARQARIDRIGQS